MSLLKDVGIIVVALFVFAIAAVTVGIIWNAISTSFTGNADIPQVAQDGVNEIDTSWGPVMDWFFIALLFGLPIVSMGLAYFNNVPALFFYVVIAVMLLFVIIGWGLQGGWQNMIANGGTFANYVTTNMALTNFVMNNFGLYTILMIAIIGYGTYVKLGGGGAGFE